MTSASSHNHNPQRLWRRLPFPLDGRDDLAHALGIAPILASLLIARGYGDPSNAHRFLHPSLDDLHDPFRLPDMDLAVARIARAIEAGEKIMVHGDYDVDGVCAAALMTRVLRALGGQVEPYVPHRKVGYDLQVASVELARQQGATLIVTVDCGIVAHEAIERAREFGLDVIVTDHHHPGETLPSALAVVNPQREDSQYPFKSLAGVGVAFKVATALVRKLGVPERSFRTKFLDLVALGTTVDCMPLVDENRIFVKFGLEELARTAKPGLKALIQVARIEPGRLDARSLGFTLGPRINAVGRLNDASKALQLLLTSDAEEADRLARFAERCNMERQEIQGHILSEALDQARSPRRMGDRVIVLADETWHRGIVGIVAGKLTDLLGRPAVMIALQDEWGRGSARSIDGFHIFNAIHTCSGLLRRVGGHEQAAGFDIAAERVDEFRKMLCEAAADSLTDDMLQPRIDVHGLLETSEVNVQLARDLRRLEPYGHGNPLPAFASYSVPLVAVECFSPKTGTQPHLRLRCRLPTSPAGSQDQVIQALYWRHGAKAEELNGAAAVDLCYHLEINEFRGAQTVQLNVQDLQLPRAEIQ